MTETKKYYVSVRGIDLEDIEVEVPKDATEDEIFNAALTEIENQVNVSAKLDYYRE